MWAAEGDPLTVAVVIFAKNQGREGKPCPGFKGEIKVAR